MAQSAGRVGFLLRGFYNPEETYEFLDVITHRRSSYITKKTAKGIEPPNDEYYQLAAAGAGASYGTSSTAGDASVKTVATVGGFSLDAGASVIVKFENDDTAGNVALDIDGTGAKPVHLNGQAVAAGAIKSDTVYEFVYDGTGYAMVSGMGGGAGGSVITVTTNESALYGRGVTITDGTDTASSAFDQAGKATFRSVMMTGTLTVSATDGESAVTGTMQVPYFGNYEYKLAFWEADITVRTDTDEFDGSTVTVKRDGVAAGTTVFSGGSASYVAPEPGSYTFECTLGWKTFTSAAVSVTEETSYNAILNGFVAPIAVSTANEEFYGATVNVPSNGSAPATAIAFDSSGNASYTAYEPGTYTFTVTYNGNDYSDTVTVSEETAYSVNVNYWTATLSITTPTAQMRGQAVTVKDGEGSAIGTTAFDGNGYATFAVHAADTYTLECVLGWRTFSAVVDVTAETTYNVALDGFVAPIAVSTASEEFYGASIAVASNVAPSTTITFDASGNASYTAYRAGTYTFTVTYQGSDYSDTVTVTEETTYNASVNPYKIYGAEWDGTAATVWTRTDSAAGFIDPTPALSTGNGSSPFDNIQPWAGMVKSTRTGGVMVSIPKFYYKLTKTGSKLKIQISDTAIPGFFVSPTHMDRGDGKGERDVVYVGRYHCHTSNYKSQTGGKPKNNIRRDTARSSIHNLGTNIWQIDFATIFTIWLLYLVEFADWDCISKIGYGNGSGTMVNMGYTDGMTYHTGTSQLNRTDEAQGTQYRNIEGLWDNVGDFVDGCYNNSDGMHIILNPSNFAERANGKFACKPVDGYVTALDISSSCGFPMFYSSAGGGSSTTYTCFLWHYYIYHNAIVVGGNYNGWRRNMFYMVGDDVATTEDAYGCRIMELP